MAWVPLEVRFWRHVRRAHSKACWAWAGARDQDGYGITHRWNAQTQTAVKVRAHRASYEMHRGPIPKGLFICHTCDNPPCVNPNHLYTGTAQDNMRDCVARGRQARGSRIGRARLTPDDVREVRRLASRGVSGADIGRRFGMTKENVYAIAKRRTWRHVS